MAAIRVAIVGVGNCASSLVQGVAHYAKPGATAIGLMHWDLGGYLPTDVEFAAAFDIDERKVGRDLAEAIFSPPNCTAVFCPEVPVTGVTVRMGAILDGVAEHMETAPAARGFVRSAAPEPGRAQVVEALIAARVDVLVNFLPVGSEEATKFYMEAALEAGVGVVNCMPVFIASDDAWGRRFADRNLPIVGDDIKAQLGATIVHRTLSTLFRDRGVRMDRTYQLNTGGNTDFLNMIDRKRLKSKKISKTEAVQSILAERLADENIHVGPSDYVPWLNDNKLCFLRLEGTLFGGVPMEIEVRLSVEDSPNSAGVVIDAIRCCMLARDCGEGGVLEGPSAFFCKHPPHQFADDEAQALTEAFIRRHRAAPTAVPCLIIAAGEGTRLRPVAPSKPLAPVVGVPMIERVIETAAQGGFDDFVVTVGYQGERVDAFLAELASDRALNIQCADNSEWRGANGLSILAAEPRLGERFILLMCDHLFDPTILEDIARQPLAGCELVLAVDRRLNNPLVRLDDVTRVQTGPDGRIEAIGKGLATYNAFDTGIFLASKALFDAIREDVAAGGGALSGAVQRLADRGLAMTLDIGDRFWIDVDDEIAFEQAESEERAARRRRHRRSPNPVRDA
ncbi:MAG TPA: NTP transferase domain-containing protein [Caulobacteraceae bacterium]|jgi:myo-inositol-1-phosphate synthase|nr:NTP transferase domain-containing protein [Caulobacteraceae bacterium]